jgi:electron transfer flavoprotein-quinone oxidoreductase
MKDFQSFKEAPHALDNPRFFNRYPQLAGDIMRDLYAVPNGPKERIYPTMMKYIKFNEMFAFLKDFWGVRKI